MYTYVPIYYDMYPMPYMYHISLMYRMSDSPRYVGLQIPTPGMRQPPREEGPGTRHPPGEGPPGTGAPGKAPAVRGPQVRCAATAVATPAPCTPGPVWALWAQRGLVHVAGAGPACPAGPWGRVGRLVRRQCCWVGGVGAMARGVWCNVSRRPGAHLCTFSQVRALWAAEMRRGTGHG